jgi:translation initiation factor 3 subunit M
MTTLVETSEEEPTLAVARAIAEIAWSQGGADIAEPAVAQFCEEAESYLIGGRYSDLANLLLTSADLVLANASEKGESVLPLGCMKTPTTWLNILAVDV